MNLYKSSILGNTLCTLLLVVTFSANATNNYNPQDQNKVDEKGWKQGHWVITAAMKATPGFKPEQVVEEGDYKDDKKIGIWKSYWPNNNIKSEIEYKNNRPNGSFKTYYENGKLEEEGTWKNGVYTGSFKRYYSNGQIAQDKTFNAAGKTEGPVTYWYPNGKKELEFTTKNGIEEGNLIRYYPNGDVKETMNFSGGQVQEGTRKEMKMVNPPVTIDETPDLVKKEAKTDPNLKANAAQQKVKDGYNKLYDDQNRLVQDGEFKNGVLQNGKWYKYDKNGILMKIEIYKNGKYQGDGQIDNF